MDFQRHPQQLLRPLLYCLSRSVLKRRTLLLLTALLAAGAVFFITGSVTLSFLGGGVVLLLTILLVCIQSYLRHIDEYRDSNPFLLHARL